MGQNIDNSQRYFEKSFIIAACVYSVYVYYLSTLFSSVNSMYLISHSVESFFVYHATSRTLDLMLFKQNRLINQMNGKSV